MIIWRMKITVLSFIKSFTQVVNPEHRPFIGAVLKQKIFITAELQSDFSLFSHRLPAMCKIGPKSQREG